MSDSKVNPTPPKITPTRRNRAARPDVDPVTGQMTGQPTGTNPIDDPDNALANSIGGINEKIEPYTKPIAATVIAVVIAGIAWALYSSEQTGARSDATLSLIQAVDSGDAEVLRDVADTYPETIAAGWASIFRGDNLLATGLDDLYRDRESAMEQLGEAKTAYQDGLSQVGDDVLVARAHLGLAKIAEAEGDMAAAVEAYQSVLDNAESDQMRQFAEQRIEFLQDDRTAEFVTWFNDQDFAPADPSLPPALPGMGELPDLPDLELPDLEELDDVDEASVEDATAEATETGTALGDTSETAETEDVPEVAVETEAETDGIETDATDVTDAADATDVTDVTDVTEP